MQKLYKVKESLLKLLRRIKRYPHEIRIPGTNGGEYEVDDMIISGPKHTCFYFRFEYILSTIFSFTVVIVTLFFNLFDTENSNSKQQFTLLKYWLRIGIILHLCAAIPKALILRRLFKIPLDNERLIVRRLMILVRSNVFFWNDKVSFVMYNYYIFGMSKLASSNICGSMASNLYRLCHFIICCFLLRLGNLFMRFFVEYYILTRNINYESIIDQGASQEEIDALPISIYGTAEANPESDSQWCGICLGNFQNGDEVRTLPCSKRHFFHKRCTDIWLRKQHICPYCRKSLRLINVQE